MEETQPLSQSELPLCDSLIIWVSARGRIGPRGRGEFLGQGGAWFSHVSLRRSDGHLRPGLRVALRVSSRP